MIDRSVTQRFTSFDEITEQEDAFYRNLPPLERLRLGVQLQEDTYGPLRTQSRLSRLLVRVQRPKR